MELFLAYLFIWVLVTATMSFIMMYPSENIYTGFTNALGVQSVLALVVLLVWLLTWSLGTIFS